MEKQKANIIFIAGLEPRDACNANTMGYLFALGGVLEEANLSFKILHVPSLPDYSIKGIIYELSNFNFDAIGMSTNSDNIRFVYKVSDAIKRKFPDKKIILGGPQATYSDEKTLKE